MCWHVLSLLCRNSNTLTYSISRCFPSGWDTGHPLGPPLKLETFCSYQICQECQRRRETLQHCSFPDSISTCKNLPVHRKLVPILSAVCSRKLGLPCTSVSHVWTLFWENIVFSCPKILFQRHLLQNLAFLLSLSPVHWQVKLHVTLIEHPFALCVLYVHFHDLPKYKMAITTSIQR